jgi:hypothetical protein
MFPVGTRLSRSSTTACAVHPANLLSPNRWAFTEQTAWREKLSLIDSEPCPKKADRMDALHMGYNVDRVNHSEIYGGHGKHTNMVESFFSRLRNMIEGQHHGVSPKYLHQYANHSAWLEDNRRTDNGTLAHIVVSNAMEAPVSRKWKGYWQRAA